MAETRRIEQEQLRRYFDAFSRQFLVPDGSNAVADVEVLGGDVGDHPAVTGTRLLGVDYDPYTNALELELESGDLRSYNPREVWAVEEPDGFISALEVVRDDGYREVVSIKRGGSAQG